MQSHRLAKLQDTIIVYITIIIYHFLTFFISYYFWKIFPFLTTKGSGVYIVFLISVFVIPNIINLNLFYENIGAEIDRFYGKIFTRELTGLGITMVKLQK